jgi:hypothetical protein
MKTFLSFFRAVRGFAGWVGQGVVMFWRVSKFELKPTEKNLLVSFWYDFAHYTNVKPVATLTDFLDSRIVNFKRVIEDPDAGPKKKQMYRDLLNALYNRSIRVDIISFLQAPAPAEGCQALIDKIYGAWRAEEGKEEVVEERPLIKQMPAKRTESDKRDKAAAFSARTYVIAAAIHHELDGRETEFRRLCREKDGLENFVKERFSVGQLPGTFEKFKRFDYRDVLKGANESKKGQLRPCFQQIMEHPEVFGRAISTRAGQIFEKYFD